MAKGNWKLPEHLEKYRNHFTNTGGNSIEDLMNRLDTDKNLAKSNVVVFTLASMVLAQYQLLEQLHKQKLLK